MGFRLQIRTIEKPLIALSLANLCFLKIWRELLFADAADSYWLPDYTLATYIATLVNVMGLTLIIYCVIAYLFHSIRPQVSTISRLFFIAILLIPLDYVRLVLGLNIGHNQ